MRLNKIACLLPFFCFLTGCNDDEGLPFDRNQIRQVADFVDTRDSKTYRCVQIGNQIWMMDNLAYFLPGGSSEGCYSWGQDCLDLENIEIEKDDFVEIYNETLKDPAHNWSDEVGSVLFNQLQMLLSQYISGMFTQERLLTTISNVAAVKPFYDVLMQNLEDYKENAKSSLVQKTHDEAEAENGGYSKTYGYLYSLDGARRAVPNGWRLPSDEDWKMLEIVLGLPASELDILNGWRGEGCGNFLKEGGEAMFEAKMAGCNAYSASGYEWIRLQECCYFWANEEKTIDIEEGADDSSTTEGNGAQTVVKEGIIRQLAFYSSKIWRGTTRLRNAERDVVYSVRCVRDLQ